LDALSNQRLGTAEYEVIIVSDGPDKRTDNMVSQWHAVHPDVNLRYLSTNLNKGPAAARNLGWVNATSPLIAFTDDDCLPERDWLASFVSHGRGEPLLAMAGQIVVPLPPQPTDFERNTAQLQSAEFVTANCCCSKDALIMVGGFDESFRMAWREDSDLHFKLLTEGIPVHKVNGACVQHPTRQAPWGISISEQKKGQYNALLYKKYPRLFREKIQRHPLWSYYVTLIFFATFCVALAYHTAALAWGALLGWSLCVALFTWKRLRTTRKSPKHVMEMMVTSILIPFVSIYWQWYGAVKYRVWLP